MFCACCMSGKRQLKLSFPPVGKRCPLKMHGFNIWMAIGRGSLKWILFKPRLHTPKYRGTALFSGSHLHIIAFWTAPKILFYTFSAKNSGDVCLSHPGPLHPSVPMLLHLSIPECSCHPWLPHRGVPHPLVHNVPESTHVPESIIPKSLHSPVHTSPSPHFQESCIPHPSLN